MQEIEIINDKKSEKILRHKAVTFDFSSRTGKEITELIRNMKETMRLANGVGLAANQIGLSESVFVAEVPGKDGSAKFYAIFNPELEPIGSEKEYLEEGCLSVPGVYGDVERYQKVLLTYDDKNGKRQKIKAWGLLARVFQHEVDHLGGKLIIDRARTLTKDE